MQGSKRSALFGLAAAVGMSLVGSVAQALPNCFTNINSHPGVFSFTNNAGETGTCQNYFNLRFEELPCSGGNFGSCTNKKLKVTWLGQGGTPTQPHVAYVIGLTSSGGSVQGCYAQITPPFSSQDKSATTFGTKCNAVPKWSYDAS